MPVSKIDDQLVEVAVANEDEVCAAAIEVSALPGERQQCRINEELLIFVRLAGGGALHVSALARCQAARAIERDVADGWGYSEDLVEESHEVAKSREVDRPGLSQLREP